MILFLAVISRIYCELKCDEKGVCSKGYFQSVLLSEIQQLQKTGEWKEDLTLLFGDYSILARSNFYKRCHIILGG